jgi:hypothetical protein
MHAAILICIKTAWKSPNFAYSPAGGWFANASLFSFEQLFELQQGFFDVLLD